MQAQLPSYNYHTYKAQRADGVSAKNAISIARMNKKSHDFPWQACSYRAPFSGDIADALEDVLPDMDEDARYELGEKIEASTTYAENIYQWAVLLRDGYVVFARITGDSEHEFNDGRGDYLDYYEKGAVMTAYARSRRNHYVGRVRKPRRIQSRKRPEYYERAGVDYDCERAWFIPLNCPIAENQAAYRKMGMAKHEAWLKAVAIARQEEAFAHGEGLEVYGAMATAFTLDGDEVGDSSVWGIEIADDDAYLTECAEDEIADALHQAAKKLSL